MKNLDFKSFLVGALGCLCLILLLSSNNVTSGDVDNKYEGGCSNTVSAWILDKETGIIKILYPNGTQRIYNYEEGTHTFIDKKK